MNDPFADIYIFFYIKMPKDARGKNRKWGNHKDRTFEEVNEAQYIENLKNQKQKEVEESDEEEE